MARNEEILRLPGPEGGTLTGHLSWEGRGASWAVVYVHGFGSVRGGQKSASLEAACARRGWTFAAFDFRGHGESAGRLFDLCCSGLLRDLETARAALAARGIRSLYPVGSSMGGWAAGWWALDQPAAIPACVMIAPAVRFPHNLWERLTEPERQSWRQTGRLALRNEWLGTELGYGLMAEAHQFPPERLAARWEKPLLIFHGLRDEVIPYCHSLEFVETAAAGAVELRLYRDGDHRLMAYGEEMAEAACAFVARHPLQT